MKLTVNGKEERVKIVELYCNITGWKLLLKIGAKTLGCSEDELNQML